MKKTTISVSAYRQVIAAFGLLFLFVFMYLYFLNLSVVHVVMRKEADHAQSDLRAEISSLETSYIDAQHKIAARIAVLDGYNVEAPKIFVTRADVNTLVRAN